MEFWMSFWKILFVVALSAFGVMAIWVSIGGFFDIKHLFEDLKKPNNSE